MGFDDFEKELFDDLDGYQSNLSLAQEWQELEDRLPKKKKRRGVFFWLFSGATIFLLFVIALFFYKKNESVITPERYVAVEEVQALAKPLDQLDLKQNNSELKRSNEITKNKSFNNKSIPPTLFPKPILKQNNYKNESSTNEPVQGLNDSPISDVFIFEKPNVSTSAKTLKNTERQISNFKTKESLATILPLSYELLIPPIKIELPDSLNIFNKFPPPSIETKWGITIGSIYGFNQFKRIIQSSDINNTLSPYEKPIDYLGFNFKLYKNLNRNFSLFSGVVVSQQTNAFEFEEAFDVVRVESVFLEQHVLITGIIEEIYGIGNKELDVTIQSKLWQRYQSISIPIGLSLHTSADRKFSLQNDFSLLWTPIQSIKGRKIIRTTNDYQVFNNNTYTKNNFFSFANQLSVNWKIKHNLFLQWNAEVGLDLSSRLNVADHYDLRFSHIGMGLGAKFVF